MYLDSLKFSGNERALNAKIKHDKPIAPNHMVELMV